MQLSDVMIGQIVLQAGSKEFQARHKGGVCAGLIQASRIEGTLLLGI